MANESLKKSMDQRSAYAEETSMLREELEKERRAHVVSKIQIELRLAQVKA